MTRSKIQKIKVFVFLLIFLLSQIASCDGDSKEKRRAASDNIEIVPSDNNKNKDVDNTKIPSADSIPAIKPKDNEEEKVEKSSLVKNNVNNDVTVVNNTKKLGTNITSNAASNSSNAANNTTLSTTPPMQTISKMHMPSMNAGAMMRGIFVIIGLSVLVMAYMVFRSFRLSNTRAQMVRKYGVLAHRQDVEMRPLPLDEDDDDDTTVFDASSIASSRLQSQVS